MSNIVLKTENLGISFGGLKAVQNLNLEIEKKQLYGLVGPNGAGKTTVFNMLTGVYLPTTGKFFLNGEDLTGKNQETINHKGIARTFQNIRLFNNMSVIRNVLVGLHSRPEYKCNPFVSMLRLPAHFENETRMREKAKEFLRIVGLEDERNKSQAPSAGRAGCRHESSRNRRTYEYYSENTGRLRHDHSAD